MNRASKSAKYQEPALTGGFVLAALGFIFASAYTEYRARDVDRRVKSIVENVIPSIEHLSTMRSELNRIRRMVRGYAYGDPQTWASTVELSAAWAATESAKQQVIQNSTAARDPRTWSLVEKELATLGTGIPALIKAREIGDESQIRGLAKADLGNAADRGADSVNGLVLQSVNHAKELAKDIEKIHRATLTSAYILNGAGIVLTLLALIFATWVFRGQRKTLEAHNEALRARAEEMEQFAGRVAHDILTPIGVASLALDTALRAADRPDFVRSTAMRGRAAVSRAKQIVEGLLEFARSGAQSSKDVSCNVAEVLHGLRGEFTRSAEEAGISLTIDAPALYVGCDVGVLTSILSNLVRNALKYIGQSPQKRVEVRAIGEISTVLFEVHDTGPGIPESLGERIFEPYVRGDHSNTPGLGLGLATVKRLVEGHGGSVGLVSRPGHGSLFWFRLPRLVPSAQPTRERRRSTRFRSKLEAEVEADSRWISARIINISRGGLLARAKESFPENVPLTVKLSAKHAIVGAGYVRRRAEISGEQEIAIEFRHDADFIASLDQLLVESKPA